MNLHDFHTLYSYNTWANSRVFDAATQIPIEHYCRDVKTGHGSIHGTLTHIVAAEKIWLSRWVGAPEKTLLHGKDVASLQDLRGIWDQVRAAQTRFLDSLRDDQLQEKFTMTTTKGDTYIHTYEQMMMHLVNHSTTHRGQIGAIMRQLGHPPANTDLITYFRKK